MICGLWWMSWFSSPTPAGEVSIEMSAGIHSGVRGADSPEGSEREFLKSDSLNYDAIPVDKMTIPQQFSSAMGFQLSQRQMGILGAVINGITAGSMFCPIHFLDENTRGIRYSFSFGVGAFIANTALWILRYFYYLHSTRSFSDAYYALPSFHFKDIWRPGCLSGLLWGSGNIFSIVAVSTLGQGVGYSVIQSSLLISGLWGIFWYKEVTEPLTIMKWFAAATLTVTSIIWLSEEHIKS